MTRQSKNPETLNTSRPNEGNERQQQATSEGIAKRAYEIYQARGCNDGADLDDWLQAERELKPPSEAA